MYSDLDPLLHSQLRLAIMSMLIASGSVDFTQIKEETGAAAGNISIQIKKLQEAGYVRVEKSFRNNYPNTRVSISQKGLAAFEAYVEKLKNYLNLD